MKAISIRIFPDLTKMESNSPYKSVSDDEEDGDIELGVKYDASDYETGNPTLLKMRR